MTDLNVQEYTPCEHCNSAGYLPVMPQPVDIAPPDYSPPGYVMASQLAEMMRVGKSTITRMIQHGGITPSLKIGNRFFWTDQRADQIASDWQDYKILRQAMYGSVR
jgi:hypothetical protein